MNIKMKKLLGILIILFFINGFSQSTNTGTLGGLWTLKNGILKPTSLNYGLSLNLAQTPIVANEFILGIDPVTGVVTRRSINFLPYVKLTDLSGTAPIVYNSTNGNFSITQSGATTNGYLSSTDWNLFNNKIGSVTAFTSSAVVTTGSNALVRNDLNFWNANKLQGVNISTTAPTNGQYLSYDGTNWIPKTLVNNDWSLQGNAGTTVGTNFVGTTDLQNLMFKVNNAERILIKPTNIAFGGNGNQVTDYDYYLGNMGNYYSFVLKNSLGGNAVGFLKEGNVHFGGAPNPFWDFLMTGSGSGNTGRLFQFRTSTADNSIQANTNGLVHIGTYQGEGFQDALQINSGIVNDSGLRFIKLNSSSPTVTGEPIGVNNLGEVVRIAGANLGALPSINTTAINKTTTTTTTSQGDIELTTNGTGIVLKDTSGTKWLLTITTTGTINIQKIN